jgi:hypothetical protein
VEEVKPHFATMEAKFSAFWRSFIIEKNNKKGIVRRHRVPYGGYRYITIYENGKIASLTYFVVAQVH